MAIKRFKTSLFSQPKQYGVSSGKSYGNPSATGGAVSYLGGYTIHTFISGSNSFTILSGISAVDYLIVAGGGSGGGTITGGGGAGGLLTGTASSLISGLFTVVVGEGGLQTAVDADSLLGNVGSNSSAFGLISIGGDIYRSSRFISLHFC